MKWTDLEKAKKCCQRHGYFRSQHSLLLDRKVQLDFPKSFQQLSRFREVITGSELKICIIKHGESSFRASPPRALP